MLCLSLTLIVCGPSDDERRISDGSQRVFEALENDTKELMGIDIADGAADGLRPEQDIRNESDPTKGRTKDS